MISQITGATVRALLVMILVAMPALILPDVAVETTQVVALFALMAAVLTFAEYATTYPGLVEFRYAPPFNRLRFATLFLTVLMLTLLSVGQSDASSSTRLIEVLGLRVSQLLDFPYSPVRLVALMLSPDVSAEHVRQVSAAAGLSYMTSLLMLAVFWSSLRLRNWPLGPRPFNVWVNLPTFDPTAGGDVVQRLERDAAVNIALGFLLPFLIPALVRLSSALLQPVTLESAQTLVWLISAWAFLPASLLMRGIAMGRVARLIREKRQREIQDQPAEMQPA